MLPRRCCQTDKTLLPLRLPLLRSQVNTPYCCTLPPWQTSLSLTPLSLPLPASSFVWLRGKRGSRECSPRLGRWPVQGAKTGTYRHFLSLSRPGSVKCESEQSGRALLARLGFAAISRRDLHCRDCRGREDSRSGKAGWEAGKHRLMRERSWKTGSLVARLIATSTGVLCLYWEWDVCSVSSIRGAQ